MHDYYFGYAPSTLARMIAQAPYTHMIRGPHDPERRTQGKAHQLGLAPHLKLNAYSHEQLRGMIWEMLCIAPGEPMTFHAISVNLFDLGADVTGLGPLDRALFSLVSDGCVAMTLCAPILFLRTCDLSELTHPPRLYEAVPQATQGSLF